MELRRKKLELSRVSLAKEEQEFKIEERMEEIRRLQAMIEIQKKKEEELQVEIEKLMEKE